jgi:2-oxo-4-hydroxy-4-carboxy--5-ureidoimidazoline (OHCU) decarboxylase
MSHPALGISFGPNAQPKYFSPFSRAIIEDIMRKSNVKSLMITSTFRDAHDGARAMLNNIEAKGVNSQLRLYRDKPGTAVIDAYTREEAAISAAEKMGIDTGLREYWSHHRHMLHVMERAIEKVGPDKVSHHSSLQKLLNVFDIAPSSLYPPRKSEFEKAAKQNYRVTKLIVPPKDPAFHFEILQIGDFPSPNSTNKIA